MIFASEKLIDTSPNRWSKMKVRRKIDCCQNVMTLFKNTFHIVPERTLLRLGAVKQCWAFVGGKQPQEPLNRRSRSDRQFYKCIRDSKMIEANWPDDSIELWEDLRRRVTIVVMVTFWLKLREANILAKLANTSVRVSTRMSSVSISSNAEYVILENFIFYIDLVEKKWYRF